MRVIILFMIYLIIYFGSSINNTAFTQQNSPSVAPKLAMEKLSNLEGLWKSTLWISNDRGKTWTDKPSNTISVSYSMKGMFIGQQNNEPSQNGWDMMNLVGYDQYRKVYRQTVMDDTWGMMDVYEGNIDEQNRLVIDNLRSKTFFPGQKDMWLAFRLTAELTPCKRATYIDVSIDEGKDWIPYMIYRFERLADDATPADAACEYPK